MEILFVTKPGFSVVGVEGQGPSGQGQGWIPPLWEAANANFSQIESIVLRKEDGGILGMWGAMTDLGHSFNRWGERGKYLAGCECAPDAKAPQGWMRWDIPGFRYIVAQCTQAEYGEVFSYVIDQYMPDNGYTLAGAVHERYPQPGNPESIELYFPIQRL